MSVESKLKELVEKVHKLGRSNTLPSGITGSSNSQNIRLDMYKKAAEIVALCEDRVNLARALNDFRGTVMVAGATNTIGSKDLEEVMNKIDEIESEL